MQVRAARTTLGSAPPREFLSNAILFTLTLSRTIFPVRRMRRGLERTRAGARGLYLRLRRNLRSDNIALTGCDTMILLTAAESRELDRLSQEKYGIESYALMR